jgi:predicted transcriptional regulator
MPLDVDSEKLLDWIGLSKKLKMTNENIVKNLQVILTNTRFETNAGLQKRGESIQTTVQTSPEPIVYLPEISAQPEVPQVAAAAQVTAAEVPQVTAAEVPQVAAAAQVAAAVQVTAAEVPQVAAAAQVTAAEVPQVTAEEQFGSLSYIQFTILKTMGEATKEYNLKAFARQVNLNSNQTIQQVQELTKKGFLQRIGNGYGITEKGKAFISARARYESENPDNQEREKTATDEKKRKKGVFSFSSQR